MCVLQIVPSMVWEEVNIRDMLHAMDEDASVLVKPFVGSEARTPEEATSKIHIQQLQVTRALFANFMALAQLLRYQLVALCCCNSAVA